jgi:hypothetical protein
MESARPSSTVQFRWHDFEQNNNQRMQHYNEDHSHRGGTSLLSRGEGHGRKHTDL